MKKTRVIQICKHQVFPILKVAATLSYRAIEGLLIYPWLMLGTMLLLDFASGNNPILEIIETLRITPPEAHPYAIDRLSILYVFASMISVVGLFMIYGWQKFTGWPTKHARSSPNEKQ